MFGLKKQQQQKPKNPTPNKFLNLPILNTYQMHITKSFPAQSANVLGSFSYNFKSVLFDIYHDIP